MDLLEKINSEPNVCEKQSNFLFKETNYHGRLNFNPYPLQPRLLHLSRGGKAVAGGKRLIDAKGIKMIIIGTVTEYNGKVQIEITRDDQIFVAPRPHLLLLTSIR